MNKLEHLEEFQHTLNHYHISSDSLRTLSQTSLVLLAGPTSVGRNTIIRELLKTGEYHYIISDTTRKPRLNDGVMEKNGEVYWFRQESEVLADLRDGKYLEAAVIHNQQVSGMSIREIEQAGREGKIAINEVEYHGIENTIAAKRDTIVLFVVPPSFDEWQLRLKHRGNMPSDEYRRRMMSAQTEIAHALEHDYYHFVLNDTIQHAAEQIHRIARLQDMDQDLQKHTRDVAEQIYIETKALLAVLE